MNNSEIYYIKRILTAMLLCVSLISFSQTLVPSDNATNISNDMVFKITFNAAPVLQSSGKISLYNSNGTLIQTIDLSTMPSGTPMNATWPWSETLNGTTIKVIPVSIDGNSVYIRFYNGKMTYNTGYYITVDKAVFSNASTLGFNGIAANNWSFTTRSQPAADLNYTISADGTGDFATLQGALDFLPTGTTNAKIFMKNGVYVGLAFIKSKNSFTIEGESKTGVIIKGFNNNNLNPSTHWRSVVNLQGDDINIINVTFRNTTPNGGTQAEVLKLNGLRCVIVNCEFYSYQDTVLIEGKVYFKDCMLEGDVDFIWGVGTVFFQSCEIRANDNGGYNVMARNDNTKHGYAFADCKLTRTSTTTATQYLGRDANTSYPYAEIVYLNCTMGSQIPAVGWNIRTEMTGTGIFFAEYKSVNEAETLINISSRHSLSKQLTDAQNTLYRDLNWFFNGWIPVVPDVQPKPVVSITAPLNNATFQANTNITLSATATVSSGTISKVEFFNGTTLIGAGTASGTTYTYIWTNVTAGAYTITAIATDNAGNTTTSTAVAIKVNVPQGPYGGTAHPIPGTIEFENFDVGGNGFAYLDNTPGSETGVAFRNDEDVDIENCGDTGGGYSLGYTTAGEWTEYTVNVASQGLYDIDLRVACNGDGRTIALQVGSTIVSSSITIPNTAAWQTYQTVKLTNVSLNAGIQIMRVTIGATDYVNLNYVTFTAVALNESPSVSITSPTTGANFAAPAQVVIEASASDIDGSIANVEFYSGTNKIGEDNSAPYTFAWNNVPVGTYSITAIATDNLGAKTTSSAVSVVVLEKDCAGIAGGTAYLDKCGTCVSGTTGLTACVPVKQQAEDACQFDGTVDSNNPGFEGTGFVNSPNAVGAKITVYIYASSATLVLFDVVYANGGTTDRSAQILLNGTQINANFLLPPTGAWTTYSPASVNIQLVQGVNKIELIAITDGGLPNIDYFGIYGDALFPGCPQTQTVSLTQGWNLISINVVPSDNSISAIFNGSDVQSIKTMNDFWYKGQPAYLNTLTTIEPGEGYLVKMNAGGILSIEGVTLSHTLNVVQKNGWQLIGCPYQTATPFSTDFNTTNCQTIKNFDGFWIPDGTMNSIQNMEPGKGYFINGK